MLTQRECSRHPRGVAGRTARLRVAILASTCGCEVTFTRRHLIEAVLTLSREGEAPTAYRLATHIGLTYGGAEPSQEDVQATLDALVREGRVKAWRVFDESRQLYANPPWITVYVLVD
jgi:hypothetical protein